MLLLGGSDMIGAEMEEVVDFMRVCKPSVPLDMRAGDIGHDEIERTINGQSPALDQLSRVDLSARLSPSTRPCAAVASRD
jgi:hypothetical protein